MFLGFPGDSGGKESACNAGDLGSIPELRRSHGGEHGNPLQDSCLENPHGQRSLVGYSPQGRKESDMTECSAGVRVGMQGQEGAEPLEGIWALRGLEEGRPCFFRGGREYPPASDALTEDSGQAFGSSDPRLELQKPRPLAPRLPSLGLCPAAYPHSSLLLSPGLLKAPSAPKANNRPAQQAPRRGCVSQTQGQITKTVCS